MQPKRLFAAALAFSWALATVPLSAHAPAAQQGGPSVHTMMTGDGSLWVNAAGMALYYHNLENSASEKFRWLCTDVAPVTTDDQQSGIGPRPNPGAQYQKSCLEKFPPFEADADARPTGEFSIVKRPDGTRQWAYRGFPLYTSVKDHRPGDRNGLGGGLFGAAGAGRFPGFRLALEPVEYPMGLKLVREEEGLVIATDTGDRPVYTPRKRKARIDGDAFEPLLAPAIVRVGGDWSLVGAGAGRSQYAFRGLPLYAAPAGLTDAEIMAGGQWQKVVVRKADPAPSGIGKQLTLIGEVYTDREGRTLYSYYCGAGGISAGPRAVQVACDDPGDPAAYMVALCGVAKECAERWRPLLAKPKDHASGDWSVVEITYPMFTDPRGRLYPADAPHVHAWAYRGRPVFTYYEDEKPGDIWGDGTKGLWGSSFSAVLTTDHSILFE
jgi:predicted lipoprotein with Yx(FWY)xxD motif